MAIIGTLTTKKGKVNVQLAASALLKGEPSTPPPQPRAIRDDKAFVTICEKKMSSGRNAEGAQYFVTESEEEATFCPPFFHFHYESRRLDDTVRRMLLYGNIVGAVDRDTLEFLSRTLSDFLVQASAKLRLTEMSFGVELSLRVDMDVQVW